MTTLAVGDKRGKSWRDSKSAWSDGRVLTSAQRERKRAMDRMRASHSRRQTARHVTALETEIRRLQTHEGSASLDDVGDHVADQPLAATDNLGAERSGDASHAIEQSNQCNIPDRTSLTDCREILNSVLHSACTLDPSQVCADDETNEDAIIRGITQGWKNVRIRHPFFCPLWKIIRLLDSRMFRLSGTITRFCTLYMIHRMLLCLVNAKDVQSLPPWFRPRPAQKALPHPLAIDVLPWPGLRERAVLDWDLTSPNRFWNDVIYRFRFIWPYEVNEAVKLNPLSRLFHFSGIYKNYVEEISMWTMDSSWFAAFPDTVDDILPALNIEWPLDPSASDGEMIAPKALPLPLTEEAVEEADDDMPVESAAF
jgi:hypothetical protein